MGLVALAGCTVLGWFLFKLAQQSHLDNRVGELYRAVAATLRSVFRLDPILTLIVFPFARARDPDPYWAPGLDA